MAQMKRRWKPSSRPICVICGLQSPAVISLEPELTQLPDTGVLIARERREAVNIYPELRVLTWAGVMLISWGVGLFVAKHLDDIGPLAIATVIGLAAAACYGWA